MWMDHNVVRVGDGGTAEKQHVMLMMSHYDLHGDELSWWHSSLPDRESSYNMSPP